MNDQMQEDPDEQDMVIVERSGSGAGLLTLVAFVVMGFVLLRYFGFLRLLWG